MTLFYDKEDILRKTCAVMVKQSQGVGELTVDVPAQAPKMIKTTIKTDFKYLFYHFDNQGDDLDYHEKQEYIICQGLQLCKPFENRNQYNVTVKAKTTSTVLIRLDATGY